MSTLDITEVSPHTLTDLLRHMQDGDQLIMTKRGGTASFHVSRKVGEKVVKTPLKNSLIKTVGFTQMKSKWISTPPTSDGFKSWSGFGKKPSRAQKKEFNSDALMKSALEFAITFSESFDTVSGVNGTFDRYTLNSNVVYCTRGTKTVVGIEENGKIKFLHEAPKLKKEFVPKELVNV